MAGPAPDRPRRFTAALFAAGLAAALLGAAAAAVLVAEHLDYLAAPGCGDAGACDRAAASVWGRVPVAGWPVSFAGLAWFAAAGGAWTAAYRSSGAPAWLRWAARGGAALSAFYVVVMIAGGYLCPYCLAAHLGSFGFLGAVERAPRAAARGSAALAWAAAAFAVVTATEAGLGRVPRQSAERELARSTQEIVESTARGEARDGFTGRYRTGPEAAPIRLVVISDYQCPECREVEAEVEEILRSRGDVSFSAKHFPMCTDCNRHVTRNPHPNACWAARAAEAAGILRGAEGFWPMHRWLFSRGGSFTNAELGAALRDLGYDVKEFTGLMQEARTFEPVLADIDEAMALGIHVTPMIFLNGVELRGWTRGSRALTRAIEALAASAPGPATSAEDRPPSALEKIIGDWREMPAIELPQDRRLWTRGPPDAPMRVVLWGDYQEPHSAAADRCVRELLARGDVSYTFRHFPVNQECNPVAPRTLHPAACAAHRAAEAAGQLGGPAAFWAMHEWLMDHQQGFSEEALLAAAGGMGLDAEALRARMADDAVTIALNIDCRAAWKLGLKSIPMVFVNEKHVPRWAHEGTCILDRLRG